MYWAFLERSPLFNKLADVLNAAARLLQPRVSEATRLGLDTEASILAIYVGGHALLGALLGVVLARTAGRPLALVLALTVADALVFGSVWRHRELPLQLGAGLLAGGALLGVAVAFLARLAWRAAPPRPLATLATGGVLTVTVVVAGTLIGAARGPRSPEGELVDSPSRRPTGVKVAILAVDGLDGILVDEAIAQGRLPNLARLAARGTRGHLRSIRPPKSPVVWTSVVTGVGPATHGITDFVVRREGQRIPVTGNLRRSPALWDLAAPAGFTSAFVNWYVSWPAEPVAGLVVSDRVDFAELGDRVFPEELTAAMDSARARVDLRPDRDPARFTRGAESFEEWGANQWGQVRRAIRVLDDVVRHDLVTLETARVALRHGQPDLTAIYVRGTDNTQHLFWKYRLAGEAATAYAQALYEEMTEEEIERLAPVVDRYYDFADEMIGEIVEQLEPETAILVLSDHGFLANRERSRWYHANRLLEAAELCRLLPGEGGAANVESSVVHDERAPSTDPTRILRAGGGALDPAGALEEAREILREATLDSGDPVFRALRIDEDEKGPRLTAVFERRLSGSSVRVAGRDVALSEIHTREGKSGDHRMNGFLLAAGGPFRSGAHIEGARCLDVAPTVLHLLGAPVARDLEGIPLVDLLEPSFRTEHPVRYVETFGARSDSAAAISTEADEAIREQLRALGYIQ